MTKQSELIKSLSDKELVLNLYITQAIMLLAAIVLSRFIFGSWLYPFTLISWNHTHLLIGIGAGLFIVLIELAAVRYLPESWFDDGGINERMFKNRSPIHIVFLSFVIGFSEELLFRGVLQTSIGFIPASLIFALIHFRYLDNIFLFSFTVAMSFFLGYLFLVTGNLLTVILCHAVIDMVLGWCIRYGLLEKIRKVSV